MNMSRCKIPLLPGEWWAHWCLGSLIQVPGHWVPRGRKQTLWPPTPLWQVPHLTSDQSPCMIGGRQKTSVQTWSFANKELDFHKRSQRVLLVVDLICNKIICTNLITSPIIALTPYSVLHTDTAWAKTDDNCSKCCSNWITFTLAPASLDLIYNWGKKRQLLICNE